MAQVGGLGAAKPVDDEVRAVFDTEEVKAKVAEVLGSAPAKFEIHSYKTQVVAGVNYRVKVNVGDSFVHIHAFRPLPHTGESLKVNEVVTGKTVECEL